MMRRVLDASKEANDLLSKRQGWELTIHDIVKTKLWVAQSSVQNLVGMCACGRTLTQQLPQQTASYTGGPLLGSALSRVKAFISDLSRALFNEEVALREFVLEVNRLWEAGDLNEIRLLAEGLLGSLQSDGLTPNTRSFLRTCFLFAATVTIARLPRADWLRLLAPADPALVAGDPMGPYFPTTAVPAALLAQADAGGADEQTGPRIQQCLLRVGGLPAPRAEELRWVVGLLGPRPACWEWASALLQVGTLEESLDLLERVRAIRGLPSAAVLRQVPLAALVGRLKATAGLDQGMQATQSVYNRGLMIFMDQSMRVANSACPDRFPPSGGDYHTASCAHALAIIQSATPSPSYHHSHHHNHPPFRVRALVMALQQVVEAQGTVGPLTAIYALHLLAYLLREASPGGAAVMAALGAFTRAPWPAKAYGQACLRGLPWGTMDRETLFPAFIEIYQLYAVQRALSAEIAPLAIGTPLVSSFLCPPGEPARGPAYRALCLGAHGVPLALLAGPPGGCEEALLLRGCDELAKSMIACEPMVLEAYRTYPQLARANGQAHFPLLGLLWSPYHHNHPRSRTARQHCIAALGVRMLLHMGLLADHEILRIEARKMLRYLLTGGRHPDLAPVAMHALASLLAALGSRPVYPTPTTVPGPPVLASASLQAMLRPPMGQAPAPMVPQYVPGPALPAPDLSLTGLLLAPRLGTLAALCRALGLPLPPVEGAAGPQAADPGTAEGLVAWGRALWTASLIRGSGGLTSGQQNSLQLIAAAADLDWRQAAPTERFALVVLVSACGRLLGPPRAWGLLSPWVDPTCLPTRPLVGLGRALQADLMSAGGPSPSSGPAEAELRPFAALLVGLGALAEGSPAGGLTELFMTGGPLARAMSQLAPSQAGLGLLLRASLCSWCRAQPDPAADRALLGLGCCLRVALGALGPEELRQVMVETVLMGGGPDMKGADHPGEEALSERAALWWVRVLEAGDAGGDAGGAGGMGGMGRMAIAGQGDLLEALAQLVFITRAPCAPRIGCALAVQPRDVLLAQCARAPHLCMLRALAMDSDGGPEVSPRAAQALIEVAARTSHRHHPSGQLPRWHPRRHALHALVLAAPRLGPGSGAAAGVLRAMAAVLRRLPKANPAAPAAPAGSASASSPSARGPAEEAAGELDACGAALERSAEEPSSRFPAGGLLAPGSAALALVLSVPGPVGAALDGLRARPRRWDEAAARAARGEPEFPEAVGLMDLGPFAQPLSLPFHTLVSIPVTAAKLEGWARHVALDAAPRALAQRAEGAAGDDEGAAGSPLAAKLRLLLDDWETLGAAIDALDAEFARLAPQIFTTTATVKEAVTACGPSCEGPMRLQMNHNRTRHGATLDGLAPLAIRAARLGAAMRRICDRAAAEGATLPEGLQAALVGVARSPCPYAAPLPTLAQALLTRWAARSATTHHRLPPPTRFRAFVPRPCTIAIVPIFPDGIADGAWGYPGAPQAREQPGLLWALLSHIRPRPGRPSGPPPEPLPDALAALFAPEALAQAGQWAEYQRALEKVVAAGPLAVPLLSRFTGDHLAQCPAAVVSGLLGPLGSALGMLAPSPVPALLLPCTEMAAREPIRWAGLLRGALRGGWAPSLVDELVGPLAAAVAQLDPARALTLICLVRGPPAPCPSRTHPHNHPGIVIQASLSWLRWVPALQLLDGVACCPGRISPTVAAALADRLLGPLTTLGPFADLLRAEAAHALASGSRLPRLRPGRWHPLGVPVLPGPHPPAEGDLLLGAGRPALSPKATRLVEGGRAALEMDAARPALAAPPGTQQPDSGDVALPGIVCPSDVPAACLCAARVVGCLEALLPANPRAAGAWLGGLARVAEGLPALALARLLAHAPDQGWEAAMLEATRALGPLPVGCCYALALPARLRLRVFAHPALVGALMECVPWAELGARLRTGLEEAEPTASLAGCLWLALAVELHCCAGCPKGAPWLDVLRSVSSNPCKLFVGAVV
ncbi:hypothetical protein PAPYR_10581 [Paratrimastix pyriformis]|uniref:Non-specific serine/threonine protein kinase n=1 Tax=Paratrimastix pyriformis TaxID=342808 RepID=A0ABQ8U5P7_9EUKA|nr:hypothetical protein PAPYR_10581 [Paratrimastix pyriformis]